MFIIIEISLFPDPLGGAKEQTPCVCVCIYTHIYICISNHMYISVLKTISWHQCFPFYSNNTEFILIFSFSLFVIPFSDSDKSGFTYL